MANSHKFVLNMSSIDWPCQMNTIKETALSASHLGGEDGGIKREEEWKNGGRKTRWESGREGWSERIDGQKDFWQQRSFFGRVAACPHVAINVYVCVCGCLYFSDSSSFIVLFFFPYPPPWFPLSCPLAFCFICEPSGRKEAVKEMRTETKMECGKEKEGLSSRKEKKETGRERERTATCMQCWWTDGGMKPTGRRRD